MTSPSLKWMRSGAGLLSLLALAACDDGGGKRTDDPKLDRDGGHHVADAGDGDAPDGGGHEREDGGHSEPDAGPEPITGGKGCGVDSLCLNLRNAYAEELQQEKSCSPKDGNQACGMQAATSLGCQSCPVWVTDTTRLQQLSKQFDDAGCGECFYGSPTGDRCHPEPCSDLGAPMCDPSGTCVPDLRCPAGAKDAAPCTDKDPSLCEIEGGGCICFDGTWMC